MWDFAMGTLSSVLVAVVITLAFAIPLGILAARSDRFEKLSRPVLDAMQTMPAFVYLVPVLFLMEPGRVPAIIASFVYALPVGIRLTNLGIREVPKEIVEAGRAFGSTLVAAPAEGAAAARPAVDPARREPDDHDGALGRDHRRD